MNDKKLLLEINIPEFITHAAKTENKIAPDKFVKINNQSIYNGSINRFSRNTVIKYMHNYIFSFLPKVDLYKLLDSHGLSNLEFEYTFKTVVNHGNIKRSSKTGLISWKKPTKSFQANWDIENLASIWTKTINDSLTKNGNIPDDSIRYLKKVSYEFIPCEDIKERNINLKIWGRN